MTATLPEGTVYHLRPKGRCASCGRRWLLRGDGTVRRHGYGRQTCTGSLTEPAFDLAEELSYLLITWARDQRTIPDYGYVETVWHHVPRRVVHWDMGSSWMVRVDRGPEDETPAVVSSGLSTAQAAYEWVRSAIGEQP